MTQPYIVVAAGREDVSMVRTAFERVGITDRLRFITESEQLFRYLEGNGRYINRTEYPFPDLLLVDLTLGARNGFDVLENIQNRSPSLRPLVIVLANAEKLRDVNEAYRLGATSFIMKPIDADDFRNTISAVQEAWKRRRGNQAA